MSQRIHTNMKVGDINPHSLLTHSRLVCVSRGLGTEIKKENKNLIISKEIDSTGYYINQNMIGKVSVFFPER